MSTLLCEKFGKRTWGSTGAGAAADRQSRCALCAGELYPGDEYFFLEGEMVCPACLERYARRRFAHRLRRVGRREGGEEH